MPIRVVQLGTAMSVSMRCARSSPTPHSSSPAYGCPQTPKPARMPQSLPGLRIRPAYWPAPTWMQYSPADHSARSTTLSPTTGYPKRSRATAGCWRPGSTSSAAARSSCSIRGRSYHSNSSDRWKILHASAIRSYASTELIQVLPTTCYRWPWPAPAKVFNNCDTWRSSTTRPTTAPQSCSTSWDSVSPQTSSPCSCSPVC